MIEWTPALLVLFALLVVCGFLIGSSVASFLCVVADRVPRGESIVSPRSRCVGCGKGLRVIDMIPVFSWLLLRGRCHGCRTRIPARFVLLELVGGVAGGCLMSWVMFPK